MVNKNDRDTADIVFYKREQVKRKHRKNKRKRFFKRFTKFTIAMSLIFIYFFSDLSKPKAITVKSGPLLSRAHVLSFLEVDSNDYILYLNPLVLKQKLKKHPLIEESKIRWSPFKRYVNIDLKEKRIFGYRYQKNKAKLISQSGDLIDFTPEMYHILPELIFVKDFEKELQKELVKSFENVNKDVFLQISEIHQHEVSYDDKLLRILMNDGNQVFTSLQTVESLNYYFEIVQNQKVTNACIFIDEMTGKVFSQKCPK